MHLLLLLLLLPFVAGMLICCCTCTVFSSDFSAELDPAEFEQLTGTWETDGGQLVSTGTTPANIQCLSALGYDGAAVRVFPGGEGDVVQLYTDDGDAYIEVKFHETDGYVKLRTSTGDVRQVARPGILPSTGEYGPDSYVTLALCTQTVCEGHPTDEATITYARLTNTFGEAYDADLVQLGDFVADGSHAGVTVESHSTGDDVRFDDFHIIDTAQAACRCSLPAQLCAFGNLGYPMWLTRPDHCNLDWAATFDCGGTIRLTGTAVCVASEGCPHPESCCWEFSDELPGGDDACQYKLTFARVSYTSTTALVELILQNYLGSAITHNWEGEVTPTHCDGDYTSYQPDLDSAHDWVGGFGTTPGDEPALSF